jgi:hypothetical protein
MEIITDSRGSYVGGVPRASKGVTLLKVTLTPTKTALPQREGDLPFRWKNVLLLSVRSTGIGSYVSQSAVSVS